ncbi:MAG: iron ABC transporter permease [Chloroflexi bacterium]|nr:iron ABC transporter permease [Chloroflexota bacterium]
MLLPLLFFALFYFYPLSAIIGVSGLAGLSATLTDPHTWRVVGFTFWQATLSTVLTFALGLPAAYLVGRYRFRGQTLLRAFTAIPFVMPTLVVAAGFNALLGPNGWLALALAALRLPTLNIVNTLAAILLAHVFYNTTIVMRLVGDYWGRLDPRLPQAAQTLGLTPLRAFAAVTLPLLGPALLAAALLVFIFDFTSFGVILVLGNPRLATLEVEIYRQTFAFFNLPAAAALALLQLACTFGLAIAYARLSARASRPIGLRAPAPQPLVTARQKLAALAVIAVLIILLNGPLIALAARSITPLDAEARSLAHPSPAFTFDYYRALFTADRGSAFFVTPIATVGNSLRYALITVAFSLALGLPTAWTLAMRQHSNNRVARRSSGLLEALLLLPLGTSAVTLGLGFLLAFNRAPLNLRASPILVPLAHTLIAFPFVVRALLPTWQSIRPQWRQAAATLGASPWRTWQRIDLPLIGRAALVAAAFAFAISLGEFGATALIYRPEYPTIPLAIYTFLGRPGALNYGRALALSTLLMVITGGSILAIERLRLKNLTDF